MDYSLPYLGFHQPQLFSNIGIVRKKFFFGDFHSNLLSQLGQGTKQGKVILSSNSKRGYGSWYHFVSAGNVHSQARNCTDSFPFWS
jgi:hypothetical protein